MSSTVVTAVSKKNIKSCRPEVKISASFDLEWIPYKGRHEHTKTKIFEASFCTNWGERIALHISKYSDRPVPEKALIQDFLGYLNQFPLTFGWYTTGVVVYDGTGNRVRGSASDLFILHQRCIFHHLNSPVEVKEKYARLANPNKKHIDLHNIFSQPIVQIGVFEGRYRTTDLDTVSHALLGIGKYGKASGSDVLSLPIEEQIRYVKRDSELTMLLAQYNNCLALRIMKVFAGYAEMDYYQVCHTPISIWYSNRYKKMLESGECTISYTPNYRLDKQTIGGGHHTHPTKGFFVGTKIYELDVKGQYLRIAMQNNFSFDTLNCTCCKYNENARVRQETIDAINEHLRENDIPRTVERYWVCRRRKGALPKVLGQTLSDRDKYLALAKVEKDLSLKEEYHTHQLGAKLFANAGVGLFGSEYFEFANYQVNECITAEGRRIHKQMESLAKNYGFEVVFGFTDSTFFKIPGTDRKVHDFIHACKDRLGAAVELKTVFVNSIFYAKKNRFVGWTGNENEEPIIKGLEGLSDLNPLWVRRWFKKIVTELVERPETRFEEITRMIREAYDEIDMGLIDQEKELKFTQRLGKDIHEYKDTGNRTRRLAVLLGKDNGDMVHWYETYKDVYADKKGKRYWKREKIYSIKPESLNLDEYKKLLLKKLKDSLEITGFDVKSLEQELAKTQPLQHTYEHAPLQVQ